MHAVPVAVTGRPTSSAKEGTGSASLSSSPLDHSSSSSSTWLGAFHIAIRAGRNYWSSKTTGRRPRGWGLGL